MKRCTECGNTYAVKTASVEAPPVAPPHYKTEAEQLATIVAFGFGVENYTCVNGQYRRNHPGRKTV